MTSIILKDGENFEQAYRRFKKLVEKAGIQAELRKREYYEKPSEERKRKELASKKRVYKKLRRLSSM